ncbi:hypothetical protein AOQ84DRAFT_228073, partial [Glonium stellatum]
MPPRGRPRGSGRGGARPSERQAAKPTESELAAAAESSEAAPASAPELKQGAESSTTTQEMPDAAPLQASSEHADQPPAAT